VIYSLIGHTWDIYGQGGIPAIERASSHRQVSGPDQGLRRPEQ
jgi:hypothetical protein